MSNTPAESLNIKLSDKAKEIITIIRLKLRDFPELNRLIEGYESTDTDIALAVRETLDDFNNTPPLLAPYTIYNFPKISLLIKGSLANLLESVGLFNTRNQLNFSDGESAGPLMDKTPQLMSWIDRFKGDYEQGKRHLKMSLNIAQAFGYQGISSEYEYVNTGYLL